MTYVLQDSKAFDATLILLRLSNKDLPSEPEALPIYSHEPMQEWMNMKGRQVPKQNPSVCVSLGPNL
jgi:hypothetical protein